MALEAITGGGIPDTRYLGCVYFQGHWWTLWHGPQSFHARSSQRSCDAIVGLLWPMGDRLDLTRTLDDRHVARIVDSLRACGGRTGDLVHVKRRGSVFFLGIRADRW